jgi:mannosyltransferase OCH1-like enzyme
MKQESPHLFVPWDASSFRQVRLRIYVEEKMWQCKADILRLEFLWHHGGVYVDADMISVGKKSLNPIVELGKVQGAE